MVFFSPLGRVFFFPMQLVCALIPCTARCNLLHTHAPLRAVPSARDAAGNLAAAPTQSMAAPAAGKEAIPTSHANVRSLGAGRGRRQRPSDVRGRPVRPRVARFHASAARPSIVIGGGGGRHARAQHAPRSATHGPSGRRIRAATFAPQTAPSRQPRPPRARWGRADAPTVPAPAVTAAAAASPLVGGPGSGGLRGTGGRGRPRQLRPPRARLRRAAAATVPVPTVTPDTATKHLVDGSGSGGRRGTGARRRPRQMQPPQDRCTRGSGGRPRTSGGVPPPTSRPRRLSRRPPLRNIVWAPSAAAAAAGQVRMCRRRHRARTRRHGGRRCIATCGRPGQRWQTRDRCARAPAAGAAAAGQVGACRRRLSRACARRNGGRRYVATGGRPRLGRRPLSWCAAVGGLFGCGSRCLARAVKLGEGFLREVARGRGGGRAIGTPGRAVDWPVATGAAPVACAAAAGWPGTGVPEAGAVAAGLVGAGARSARRPCAALRKGGRRTISILALFDIAM